MNTNNVRWFTFPVNSKTKYGNSSCIYDDDGCNVAVGGEGMRR